MNNTKKNVKQANGGPKGHFNFPFCPIIGRQSSSIWLLEIRSFSGLNDLFVGFEKLKMKIKSIISFCEQNNVKKMKNNEFYVKYNIRFYCIKLGIFYESVKYILSMRKKQPITSHHILFLWNVAFTLKLMKVKVYMRSELLIGGLIEGKGAKKNEAKNIRFVFFEKSEIPFLSRSLQTIIKRLSFNLNTFRRIFSD